MKRIIFLLVVFFGALLAIRFFSGEDNWVCENGEWVRHGMPIVPQPTGGCGRNTEVEEILPTEEPMVTDVLSPTATPSSFLESDTELIRAAFADRHGKTVEETNINISKYNGTHAWGSGKFEGEIAGAWLLAYKDPISGWMIVDAGNGTITCEIIAPYDFPVDMVPECVDNEGTVVIR